jgi:large subunit ribosomal protein L21
MAFAVIRTGGKQYRVEPGSVIRVESLAGDVGSTVEFTEVLLASGDALRIGTPLVDGVTVRGEIVGHLRDKKVLIFRIHPGPNVGVGRDWTLFALVDGLVKYERFGKDRTRVRIVANAPAPQA